MAKTFIIKTQEDMDELKSILQQEFDRGNGLAMATAVRQLKFIKSRNVYDATMSYAPDTFDKIKRGYLPKSAIINSEDSDLIIGIWSSKSISQEEE